MRLVLVLNMLSSLNKDIIIIIITYLVCIYILSTKRNAMFLFAILGMKIINFKSCFNSVVLPTNQDLECRVSS